MSIPDPSWDCPCGVRNAGTFFHCRRCSSPRPAPPRDPDEWLKIRVGTPISYDIWRAILAILAFISIPLLAFVFLRWAPWDAVLSVLAGLSLIGWPAIIVLVVVLLLARIARGIERIGR